MHHGIMRVLAGLVFLLFAAGPAAAAKVGSEFVVTTDGLNSAVARLSNGNIVVVWRGDSPHYRINGQIFNNIGKKVGGAFNVAASSRELATPSVAALAQGGFVVTWDGPDQNGLGAFFQRFAANGAKAGARTRANTFVTADQFAPTVVGLDNGTFVVMWTSNGQDGSDSAAYGRRYSATGVKIGGEFRIDTTFPTAFHQYPSGAALASGGFVVVYRGYNGTYARRFSVNGVGLGNDFQVNEVNEGLLQRPVVARLGGGFVVVREVSGATRDVFMRRYNSAGAAIGGSVRVNATPAGEQFDPVVTGLTNGRYVVVWSDGTSTQRAKARLYSASGVAIGGNINVNKTVIPIDARPSVGPLGNGGFVATWQGAAPNATFAVRGQRFNSTN